MKKILVTGGGGFVGGHLISKLRSSYKVISVDRKPLDKWYQCFDDVENIVGELADYDLCLKVTEGVDAVFHLACNMGGMGFIENNKAECMMSVIPDTLMLKACKENNVNKFLFTSSACVYPKHLQNSPNPKPLHESDAYPADSEDGYGWEKLFIERMCRHYMEDYGIDTKVIRFHTIYGPNGTWEGGREKAPAALARKVINAKYTGETTIEVWGDGNQVRSFLYIDDCIDGIMKVFDSSIHGPINVGSETLISVNDMVSAYEKFAGIIVDRKYILDAPLGVRGRNSDSSMLKSLGWTEKTEVYEGLRKTFEWIEEQYKRKYL
jgi:nucleoside-diphosphate-sugar epimerase